MNRFLNRCLLAWCLVSTAPAPGDTFPAAATGPSPDLVPADVVRIQVDSLRTNDAADRGIARVFAFASPGNRSQTGPLERFVAMVHRPPYAAMLGHREARFGPIAMTATEARQTVTLVSRGGETVTCLWILSRQTHEACNGCWMTDAVIPLDAGDDGDRTVPAGTVT
jgi:hypothetical protein